MGINLPDIAPFGLKQVNTGQEYQDGQGDVLPVAFNKLNYNTGILAANMRERLYAHRTLYVAPGGNDTNHGLTTLLPLATVTAAVNKVYEEYDLNGYTVTIQLGDGTYTESVKLVGLPLGTSSAQEYPLIIKGNAASPNLTTVQSPAIFEQEFALSLRGGARARIEDIQISAISRTSLAQIDAPRVGGLSAVEGSRLAMARLWFSVMPSNLPYYHIYLNNSLLELRSAHKLYGAARAHIYADNASQVISLTSAGLSEVYTNAPLTFYAFLILRGNSYINVPATNIEYAEGTPIYGYSYDKDFQSSIVEFDFISSLSPGITQELNLSTKLSIDNDLDITGTLTVADGLDVGGYLNLDGNFTSTGFIETNGHLVVLDEAFFGDNAEVKKDLIVNEKLDVLGKTTLGDLTINGELALTDTFSCSGTATFTGLVKITNALELPDASIFWKHIAAVVPEEKDKAILMISADGTLQWSSRLTNVEEILPTLAPIESPSFKGTPTAPHPSATTANNQIATSKFTQDLVAAARAEFTDSIKNHMPVGSIIIWSGDLSSIPAGFVLCFTGDTDITLADGSQKSIREIVDNRLDVEVLSLDEATGKLIPKRVTNWYKSPSKKEDFAVIKRSSTIPTIAGSFRTVKATWEHPFLAVDGWTEVKDLEGKKVTTVIATPDYITEQVVLGTLMGDASVTKEGTYNLTHGLQQREYMQECHRLLMPLNVSPIKESVQTNGYGKGSGRLRFYSQASAYLHTLRAVMYSRDKKAITKNILAKLSPIGMAFWVADDGCLQTDHRSGVERLQIHTECFSPECLGLILSWLEARGLIATTYKRGNTSGSLIRFDGESTQRLGCLIAPYMPVSMRYKLPLAARAIPYTLDTYSPQSSVALRTTDTVTVKPVTGLSPSKRNSSNYHWRYNIEVEDTHTYIANGFVVHNCDGANGTPDLGERFVYGAKRQDGQAVCILETGGAAEVSLDNIVATTSSSTVEAGNLTAVPHVLTLSQIPQHTHIEQPTVVYYGGNEAPIKDGGSSGKKGSNPSNIGFVSRVTNTSQGGGQAHGHAISGTTAGHTHAIQFPAQTIDNMPPFIVLAYIMRKEP